MAVAALAPLRWAAAPYSKALQLASLTLHRPAAVGPFTSKHGRVAGHLELELADHGPMVGALRVLHAVEHLDGLALNGGCPRVLQHEDVIEVQATADGAALRRKSGLLPIGTLLCPCIDEAVVRGENAVGRARDDRGRVEVPAEHESGLHWTVLRGLVRKGLDEIHQLCHLLPLLQAARLVGEVRVDDPEWCRWAAAGVLDLRRSAAGKPRASPFGLFLGAFL